LQAQSKLALDIKRHGRYARRAKMFKHQSLLIDIGQGLSVMVGLPKIASWDSRSRPEKARTGTIGFNSQTSSLEYFDGSYWLAAPLRE